MKHQKIDENRIEVIPEGETLEDVLMAIARHSYDTATPRIHANQHLHMAEDSPDLSACITYEGGAPVMLLMDYINDRDCRTKVYNKEGRWYFDAYAFGQRKVTSQEFLAGIRREYAEKFLAEVAEILSAANV